MGMDLVPVYADQPGQDDGVVRISPSVEQNLGVRTSTVTRRNLQRRIEAAAYVGFDETRLTQVNLRTDGWVQRLLIAAEGERVHKGQLLFEFYSPHLVNAQKEYVQARRRGDGQLQVAAQEKLLALGVTQADLHRLDQSSQVTETIQVLAPQDGIITGLYVKEGMFITPAMAAMSLADLDSVWLIADVFESQSDLVQAGQAVEARLNAIPGEVYSGTVDYVYPVLDVNTRTLRTRMQFDNPDERLRPNMFGTVSILGMPLDGALSIPREALIRGASFDRVVMALGDGRYTVREVTSGMESGGWVEIRAGLEAGEEVVSSAQFMIDSEASVTGAIQRFQTEDETGDEGDTEPVYGGGIVREVDHSAHRIRISHDPIEALGWPGMTMYLDVSADISLDGLTAGDSIHFSLERTEDGSYAIVMIHRMGQAK